jgi:hypothetical protein
VSGPPRDGDDGWGYERLGAAFRARADAAPRPLPADLVEATLARVRRVEPRRPWFAGRSFVGLATAATVVVAVGVFGVATLGPAIRPAASPSASTGAPSQPIASVPSASAAAPGLGTASLPLLDVAGAVAIRDGGADDREIRVQGFFAGIPVIFCALMLGPVNPTRTDCAPATITQNRVPLPKAGSTVPEAGATFLASFAIVGLPDGYSPNLPPTTSGSPRPPTDGVTMLTLVGHFDDRRADLCPAQQVVRCRDTFMVDRVDAVGASSLETQTYDASRAISGGTSVLHPRLAPEAVDRLLQPIDPAFTILSRRLQTANLLPPIEPAWATAPQPWTDNVPNDERVTWLVTAMSSPDGAGHATVRTFVIDDRSGTILEIDRDGTSVAWVPPTATMVGRPMTVSEAIDLRDQHLDDTELAIRGIAWAPSGPIACSFVAPSSPAAAACPDNFAWIAEQHPLGSGSEFRQPIGPAFNLLIRPETYRAIELTEATADVTVLGHFGDHRAAQCEREQVEGCRRNFLVDAILDPSAPSVDPARVKANLLGLPVQTTARATDVKRALPIGSLAETHLLAAFAIPGDRVALFEPQAAGVKELTSARAVWIVRYVDDLEEGRPLAYTKLVIDGPPSGLSGWIYTPTPGGMGREFTIYN